MQKIKKWMAKNWLSIHVIPCGLMQQPPYFAYVVYIGPLMFCYDVDTHKITFAWKPE